MFEKRLKVVTVHMYHVQVIKAPSAAGLSSFSGSLYLKVVSLVQKLSETFCYIVSFVPFIKGDKTKWELYLEQVFIVHGGVILCLCWASAGIFQIIL